MTKAEKADKPEKAPRRKWSRQDVKELVDLGIKGDTGAVDQLLGLTGKVDPVLLPFVIKGLGEVKSREAFQGLLELMAERNMKDLARYLVKMVLSKEGYLQRQFLLEALTQTQDEDVLLFLVSLVGKWQLAEAEPKLLEVYHREDQSPEVRGAILAALGQMGTEACLSTLKEALGSESDFMVYNAGQAMWRVGLRIATYPLLMGIRRGEHLGGVNVSTEGLFEGEETLPMLLDQYRSKRPEERQMVLDSLIKIGRPAVKHLLGFLGDSDENLRILAATQLGYIGDEESVDHLLAALDTPSENTRFTVVEALGKIGHPKAIPSVVHALEDPSDQVRAAAYEALYNLDPKTFFKEVVDRLPQETSRVVLSYFTRIIEDSVLPQGLETITDHLENVLPGRGRDRLKKVLQVGGGKDNVPQTWARFAERWRTLLTDDQQGLAGVERLLEKMIAFAKTTQGSEVAVEPLHFSLKQLRRHRPVLENAPGALKEFNHAVTHFLENLAEGEGKEAGSELTDTIRRLIP